MLCSLAEGSRIKGLGLSWFEGLGFSRCQGLGFRVLSLIVVVVGRSISFPMLDVRLCLIEGNYSCWILVRRLWCLPPVRIRALVLLGAYLVLRRALVSYVTSGVLTQYFLD